MSTFKPWMSDPTELADLIEYLVSTEAMPISEVGYLLRKPWKWEAAYDAMRAGSNQDGVAQ